MSNDTTLDSALEDDLDDVEGHGLREVAAGLGAAAVLAGGAAGAASLASPQLSLASSHPVHTTVATAKSDVTAFTHPTEVGPPPPPAPSSSTQEDHPITQPLRDPDLRHVIDQVDHAQRTVHELKGTATAKEAVLARNVESDLNNILPPIYRKAATVLSVVTTTASDGVHTSTINLKASGAPQESAAGWILVKTGDKVLAQVQVIQGKAIASWILPTSSSGPVTVAYTGDNSFAPTTRDLAL